MTVNSRWWLPMTVALVWGAAGLCADHAAQSIKAFCIDFNWGPGGPNGFAAPGLWADADPAEHVGWYEALGANVIQTFCVSCNGYAWYKGGVVSQQPGLKHDFLPEVVRLAHGRGMRVMGYFCIGANTRWGQTRPKLSYGCPSAPHIPYTDEYLEYLDTAIRDAVRKTGIDGFMIDWVWQPNRNATKGKWLAGERRLFEQLLGRPFPGEEALTEEQDLTYSRKAIERCWETIHRAAKQSRAECTIWLSCNKPTHPHVVNSRMFGEIDWLMNEGGDLERIKAVKPMTGEHTRLLTCLANWNRQDPTAIVPAALREGIGLYGFTRPTAGSLLPPIRSYLSRPVAGLRGDARNIACLARAFHGAPLDTVMNADGRFVQPRTILSPGLSTLKALPDTAVNLARRATPDSPDGIPIHGKNPPVSVAGAIDGNPETYWDDIDDQELYRLRLTFPNPTRVCALSITGWEHHDHAAKDFSIVCDGKTVGTVREAQYVDNRLVVAFPATVCTTLELAIEGWYGHSPAVRELEVYDRTAP